MINTPRIAIALLALSLGFTGCDEASSAVSMSPTPVTPATPVTPPTASAVQIQPSIAAVTPNAGSTGGDAWGTITGSEFQAAATVRFGERPVRQVHVRDSTTIMFWTAAHAAGTVDVVVTNPSGLAARLAGGYTYAPAESFEFNGQWMGHAGDEYEKDMPFTIENNVLVSLSCDGFTVTLSPPPAIGGGEFAFVGNDGVAITGRVVSPVNAVGTITVPPCATRWWADRK